MAFIIAFANALEFSFCCFI